MIGTDWYQELCAPNTGNVNLAASPVKPDARGYVKPFITEDQSSSPLQTLPTPGLLAVNYGLSPAQEDAPVEKAPPRTTKGTTTIPIREGSKAPIAIPEPREMAFSIRELKTRIIALEEHLADERAKNASLSNRLESCLRSLQNQKAAFQDVYKRLHEYDANQKNIDRRNLAQDLTIHDLQQDVHVVNAAAHQNSMDIAQLDRKIYPLEMTAYKHNYTLGELADATSANTRTIMRVQEVCAQISENLHSTSLEQQLEAHHCILLVSNWLNTETHTSQEMATTALKYLSLSCRVRFEAVTAREKGESIYDLYIKLESKYKVDTYIARWNDMERSKRVQKFVVETHPELNFSRDEEGERRLRLEARKRDLDLKRVRQYSFSKLAELDRKEKAGLLKAGDVDVNQEAEASGSSSNSHKKRKGEFQA